MFDLIFGIIWTIVSLLIFVPITLNSIQSGEGIALTLLCGMIFVVVGVVQSVIGFIKIVKDKKKEKHGEECYGIIEDIEPTGYSVGDHPELKAKVQFYIQSQNKIERLYVIIGIESRDYPINSYVRLKYYNGEIDIKEVVNEYLIPEPAKSYLEPVSNPKIFQGDGLDITYMSANEVEINGEKYRKVD